MRRSIGGTSELQVGETRDSLIVSMIWKRLTEDHQQMLWVLMSSGVSSYILVAVTF